MRNTDTAETLRDKVELATILGTYQSTLTNFKYLRKKWKENCDEERLLGVSMTGIMDNAILRKVSVETDTLLRELKQHAIDVNKLCAASLGINASVAITTVKPSGTVSQLVDCASGIHPRHNAAYVRTVRADVKDPLALFLKDQGVPVEPDQFNASNLVFSFPIKAPDNCVTRNDISAKEQLEHYLMFQQAWCEHNPSITVYVKNDEWLEIGAWVYKHLDKLGGVSFLPHNDHVYPQAPYQDITMETYNQLVEDFPLIAWEEFDAYETDDSTVKMAELACVNGACELI